MLATLLRAGVAPQRVVGSVVGAGARSFVSSSIRCGGCVGGVAHGSSSATRQAGALLRGSLLAREPAVRLIHTHATAAREGGVAGIFLRGRHLSSLWCAPLRQGRRGLSQQASKKKGDGAAVTSAKTAGPTTSITKGPAVATASESGNQAATAWYRTSFAKHVAIVGGVVGAASFIVCVQQCLAFQKNNSRLCLRSCAFDQSRRRVGLVAVWHRARTPELPSSFCLALLFANECKRTHNRVYQLPAGARACTTRARAVEVTP
jgi:hypothetical protein